MDKEELEQTRKMSTMMIELDEEDSILDSIDQFEEKLEYMDIPEDKKEKLKEMCKEIKEEDNENTREYLLKLLQKEVNQ